MLPYNILHAIENALESIGIRPYDVINPEGTRWSFTYKNSNIMIDVFAFAETPDVHNIQIVSTLCKMVEGRKEEFAIDLLEINYNLFGCGICKVGDWIYILHLRTAAGLGSKELVENIEQVAHYSLDYWNKLSFKYKGSWNGEPVQE